MTASLDTRRRKKDSALGRLTQAIVDDMGAAIVSGQYQPNDLLPVEAELALKYGASRSVLRESIKVLNAKGLVTARPRKGTSVTPASNWNLFDPDILDWILRSNFSLPLLIEFTYVRIGIEPVAAWLAASHADEDANMRIREGFERMVAASKGDDDPLQADIEFHLAILDASRNRFYQRLKPFVETALHFSIRYTNNIARDEDMKMDAHRNLFDAIMEHKPDKASKAAEKLLIDARSLMEEGLPAPPRV